MSKYTFNLSLGLKPMSLLVWFIMPSIVLDILQFLEWLQEYPAPVSMTVHPGSILLANKNKSHPWSLALGDPKWLETVLNNFE